MPTIRAQINNAYYALLTDQHRWLVLYGGAGSGKSYFAAQKVITRVVTERKHRILCTRKVARTLRQSVFAMLLTVISQWGIAQHFKVNHSEMTLTYMPNGSQILCAGLDNVEKLKSIVGVSSCWHEEATELNPNDLMQLDLRLRDETGNYKQHILTFNPISKDHHLKQRFFDLPSDNVYAVRTTHDDNVFVGHEYRSVINDLKDQNPSAYQIYGLGEWGDIHGLIYKPPAIGAWTLSPEFEFYGLDFGFNNPTALVNTRVKDWNPETGRGRAYINECIYESGLTNQDLIDRMKAINVKIDVPIYADSAEPARIEEISRHGFWIEPCYKGQGSVHSGITFVQGFDLYTWPECTNIIKEMSSYCWKVDRNGKTLDEPVPMFDHAMDAVRYGIYTHLKDISGYQFDPYAIDPDTGEMVRV